jgi:hypothetical protein
MCRSLCDSRVSSKLAFDQRKIKADKRSLVRPKRPAKDIGQPIVAVSVVSLVDPLEYKNATAIAIGAPTNNTIKVFLTLNAICLRSTRFLA